MSVIKEFVLNDVCLMIAAEDNDGFVMVSADDQQVNVLSSIVKVALR